MTRVDVETDLKFPVPPPIPLSIPPMEEEEEKVVKSTETEKRAGEGLCLVYSIVLENTICQSGQAHKTIFLQEDYWGKSQVFLLIQSRPKDLSHEWTKVTIVHYPTLN